LLEGFKSLEGMTVKRARVDEGPKPRQLGPKRGLKVKAPVFEDGSDSDDSVEADELAARGELALPPKLPKDGAGDQCADARSPAPPVDAAPPFPPPAVDPPPLPHPRDVDLPGELPAVPVPDPVVAAPEPPPPPPKAGAARPPRERRHRGFGPFGVAEVSLHGEIIGWGGTCGRHRNVAGGGKTRCKIQLPFGRRDPIPSDVCRAKVKAWLLEGLRIPPNQADGQSAHVNIKPRYIEPDLTDAEMDARVEELVAAADEREAA
jgi:hypothetical protein